MVLFARFERPWLAALGAAGVVWLIASFLIGAVAPNSHPLFATLALVLHVLGLAALVGGGLAYTVFFWRDYLDSKFVGRQ